MPMLSLHRRTAELVTALVLLALVAFLMLEAAELPPSPVRGYPGAAFFPMLALGGTGLFILAWIAVAILRRPAEAAASRPGGEEPADAPRFAFELRDYLVTIAATLAFVYGMNLVGFEISAFAVLAVLLWTRMANPAVAVATAALTMLVLYGTFVLLLNVSMPLLVLPRYVQF
jgi:hypothetical protein